MYLDATTIKSHARWRWLPILVAAGIPEEYLKNKNGPCPFCNGKDRWRWDDKGGDGTGFCNQCDATGDGLHLVAKAQKLDDKLDFHKILAFVANELGLDANTPSEQQKNAERLRQANKIWGEAVSLDETHDTPAHLYLQSRGLIFSEYGPSLRFHPGIDAYADKQYIGKFPAMIACICDANATLTGIHRTFLSPDGKKAHQLDGSAKQFLGKISGSSINLSKNINDVIGIGEGIETTLSARLATDMPVICAASGTVLKNLPVPKTVTTVHIWADLDKNEAGAKYAHALATRLNAEGKKVYIHFPPQPIPEDKSGIDWNDTLQIHGKQDFINALHATKEWEPVSIWSPIEPLPSLLSEVPALDLEMLPEGLRPWIADLSDRMQLPPEFFIGCALVVLASVIGRRCAIYPMQKNDWIVVPCLWGGLIAPPSVLKSPAMAAAIAPLRKLEAETAKKFDEAIKKYNEIAERQKLKIDALNGKLKRDSRAESLSDLALQNNLDEIKKLKAEVDDSRPWLARYSTNDATTEKLGELLKENPNGLFVFRDELYGFLKNLEKHGRENDRAFYLEAWNGLGSYTFDRVGRGTIHIRGLCVSIFGGIQPDRLNRYFSFILGEGSGDDGFLSRFQILLYPDLPKTYTYTDRAPNLVAKDRVNRILRRLVELPYRSLGLEIDKAHEIAAFRFSEQAQQIFKNWFENFQRRLLTLNSDTSFVSHLGKYRSLFPALALIFHLVDNCESENVPLQVLEGSANRALYWVNFLEEHARRVYGQVINIETYAAHALAKKIQQGKLFDGMKVRDIYRNEWSGLSDPETVRGGLAYLAKLNWLVVDDSSSLSEIVRLHPELTKGEKNV